MKPVGTRIHSLMGSYLLPDPPAPGSIPIIPEKNFREKIIDVAEVDQQRFLEGSWQWLENVVQNHQVLASGQLLLQKDSRILGLLRRAIL